MKYFLLIKPCKLRLRFSQQLHVVCLCHGDLEKQQLYKKSDYSKTSTRYFHQPELEKLNIFAELELKKIKLENSNLNSDLIK